MTGAQMLSEFKLGFDVIASSAAPGFTDPEIYSLLNRGQDYVILDLYKQKEFVFLQSLFKESTVTLTLTADYYEGSLPADYWLINAVSVYVSRSGLTTTGFIPSNVTGIDSRLQCDIISNKEALDFYSGPFNVLRIWKNPKAYLRGNYIRVITDNYTTITSGKLLYIRKRLDISSSQTCELQESLHRSVVDKTIDIAKIIINVQEDQVPK